MHLKYRNVNDAFTYLVSGIFSGGIKTETLPSRAGEVLVVEEPVIVTYDQPRERVLFNPARDCNPFFHVFEALWMLTGRNDVEPLAYFNSEIAKIASDDGVHFNGAYGFRWRKHPGGIERVGNSLFTIGIDQIKIVVDQLKRKPESRRVVLQMWNVRDDLLKIDTTKDACCNVCAFFLVERGPCIACDGQGSKSYQWAKEVCVRTGGRRVTIQTSTFSDGRLDWYYVTGDGRDIAFKTIGGPCSKCNGTPSDQPRYLNMTVINRSNDLIWGMLGANYVHFSILQEYIAASVGLEVGVYHQITNNLHTYTERWEPEKWLGPSDTRTTGNARIPNEVTKDWYGTNSHGPLELVPLVQNVERFDRELDVFVDRKEDGAYYEPFLRDVASPMCLAFRHHKERDYIRALEAVEQIRSEDWRYVSKVWIEKREANWERKNATEDNRNPYLERELRRQAETGTP